MYPAGSELFIATKHGKEIAFTPDLLNPLGFILAKSIEIDTDQFGTFSGEVARSGSVLDTLRKKCDLAHELTGHQFIVASEGSFGPHPMFPMIHFFEEYMLFKDYKNGHEIIEKHTGTETNLSQHNFRELNELEAYLNRIGFPAHAVILSAVDASGAKHVIKGINEFGWLKEQIERFIKCRTAITVETDMRAHMNPTRMRAIEACAVKLIARIGTCCPSCSAPGFGVVSSESGLPCSSCGLPTSSMLHTVYSCSSCTFTEKRQRTDKLTEDPMYCNFCNP
jgi:hypothetical protein